MAVFFDLWQRLENGAQALTVAPAVEVVETGVAAGVAVLAASCRIGSSSPMEVYAAAVAALCLVGKVSAT